MDKWKTSNLIPGCVFSMSSHYKVTKRCRTTDVKGHHLGVQHHQTGIGILTNASLTPSVMGTSNYIELVLYLKTCTYTLSSILQAEPLASTVLAVGSPVWTGLFTARKWLNMNMCLNISSGLLVNVIFM